MPVSQLLIAENKLFHYAGVLYIMDHTDIHEELQIYTLVDIRRAFFVWARPYCLLSLSECSSVYCLTHVVKNRLALSVSDLVLCLHEWW